LHIHIKIKIRDCSLLLNWYSIVSENDELIICSFMTIYYLILHLCFAQESRCCATSTRSLHL